MAIKLDPAVATLVKPIIEKMTRVDVAQRTNPIIDSNNEPEWIKEEKKSCVHIIFENGEYRLRVAKRDDGDLWCETCGRKIATKFDKTAIDKIMDCIEVINQVLLFGMLNGMRAEPIATLISIKRALPAVAKLAANLNSFVKKESTALNAEQNIGIEYQTSNKSFTSMM